MTSCPSSRLPRGLGQASLLGLTALCLLSPRAGAQNARVVSANASNGKILEITFNPPGSTQLNTDANTHVSLQSIVFREDGAQGIHLVVADSSAGEVLFYANGVGNGQVVFDATSPGAPVHPDGLSQDPAHNLFGVTSATGASSTAVPRVWVLRRDAGCPGASAGCLPGGYVGPVAYLDDLVEATTLIGGVPTVLEADLLAETVVVDASAGLLVPGDLLVLCSSPAMLLRYPAASVQAFLADLAAGVTPAELTPETFIHPPDASVPPEQKFPLGSDPNGMDFTPTGNLLISSGNGLILNYLPDGTRLSNGSGYVDFASGLGQGKFKIATGLQDGAFRAFVADRNGGEILRFKVEANGTGTLDGVVPDPEFPVGIATTTGSVVATPAGNNILVSTSDLLTSTVQTVPVAGATSVQEFVFVDPREAEVATPIDQPLHRSLFLSEVSAKLPPGIEIPAYVRAQRTGDPITGEPTFVLFLVDSSAGVFGVVSHISDEEVLLGYPVDCNNPDPTLQPRLFWVPTPGEAPIPEGSTFINVSNDCGSSKGLTRSFSLFLASARDTRPFDQITTAQLNGLGKVLSGAGCIASKTKNQLRKTYAAVVRHFEHGRIDKAISSLQTFISLANGSPQSFSGCQQNELGALTARASAAIFNLQKQL